MHALAYTQPFVPPLTPAQRVVRAALQDARGIFASDGMTARHIALYVLRSAGVMPGPDAVEATLSELQSLGLAAKVTGRDGVERWKEVGRG